MTRILEPEQDADTPFSVILDHGRGLYSIIHGLEEITVATGNGVVAGAVLGKARFQTDIPSSGGFISSETSQINSGVSEIRWQCLLNGAAVDPLILTQLND